MVQGSLQSPEKTYASDVAYLPHGAVQKLKLGNGLWESAAYNSRLQPVDLKLGTSDGGHELWRLENGYGTTSNNGNVLGQTITMPKSAGGTLALTQTYNGVSYDGVNRLKQASESGEGTGWTQSFSYDQYGNLVQSGDGLPPGLNCTAYTTSNNRCQGLGYDNAGNVVSYATRSLEYDAENRQTSLTDGGTTFNYSYDGEGRRVKKVVGTETTVYVYL